MKGASVHLSFLIAAANNLDVLTGNVSNSFVNVKTPEKIHCHAGPEFGEKEGQMIEAVKACGNLKSSVRVFHDHLVDTL